MYTVPALHLFIVLAGRGSLGIFCTSRRRGRTLMNNRHDRVGLGLGIWPAVGSRRRARDRHRTTICYTKVSPRSIINEYQHSRELFRPFSSSAVTVLVVFGAEMEEGEATSTSIRFWPSSSSSRVWILGKTGRPLLVAEGGELVLESSNLSFFFSGSESSVAPAAPLTSPEEKVRWRGGMSVSDPDPLRLRFRPSVIALPGRAIEVPKPTLGGLRLPAGGLFVELEGGGTVLANELPGVAGAVAFN
ncbi:hypothetical protein CPB86DRAFT_519070 [Serendipita vermifera]|nr:hypothetical protein CPB86DRAFT_519070 [Serendipita vermifera]